MINRARMTIALGLVAVLIGLFVVLTGQGTGQGDERELTFMKPPEGVINVTDYVADVENPGTDKEDWQPAFQKAIEVAQQELRPLYVPAGEYKTRQPIVIVPVKRELTRSGWHCGLRVFGDGHNLSVISQQVETENVIDWTGLTYRESAYGGHLSHIGLRGGKTALNIKWHNNFTLESCYIHGPMEYGIHAEGWSSRFLNSGIRWCRKAGIYAGGVGTFNNCIIRDCYFSRNGIGFHMPNRGFGNRIEGCAFEKCAKAAIYLGGTMELGKHPFSVESFTINNCYFEQNGYSNVSFLPVEGPVSTIHLDHGCAQITIHDCNFFLPWAADRKPGEDKIAECPAISIAYCRTGHIYDNVLNGAIQLRAACETPAGTDPLVSALVVENNRFRMAEPGMGVTEPLVEEEPGLIEQAISQHSVFRMVPRITCEGSPVGQVRPQCLGDEILDTESNTWYKASGPTVNDWVPLN